MNILVTATLKLLYYLPESFILALASLTYIDIKPPKKKLLVFTLVFSILTFFVRDIIVPHFFLNGLHSLLLIIANIFLLKFIFNLRYPIAVLCDLLFFMTIYIFEIISIGLIISLNFPLSQFMEVNQYYNFLGLIPLSFISLFIFFLRKTNITLIPVNKLIEMMRK